ncbi:MAG: 30S ribosome-binding factor RbfA [candidate division Zixibacteria bacterium]|nr:30S ribosome-binding factor RbfA [candidate division Zixibacteria bacterium]
MAQFPSCAAGLSGISIHSGASQGKRPAIEQANMKTFPRSKRVADNVRKQMSILLDEQLAGQNFSMVSVTDVEMTRDLRHAKVFYSVLGDENARTEIQEFLEENTRPLRGKLAQRMALKFVPELTFAYDSSLVEGMKIQSILTDLERERQSGPEQK